MTATAHIRILLIEDNPTDVLLLNENLLEIQNESFTVHNVSTLEAALHEQKTDNFDIVIMDLNLPDSQGLKTFARFREHAETTPILVLTSVESYELGVEAVQMGAQDFMVKHHVQPNLLSHAIRFAIERNHIQNQGDRARTEDPAEQEVSLLEELLFRTAVAETSELAQGTSLRTSNPVLFDTMVSLYQNVLRQGIAGQTVRVDNILSCNLHILGNELGQGKSKWEDIIEIHLHALRYALSTLSEHESLVMLPASRVAVLSLMGYVADFYRKWHQKPDSGNP